jgi:hypothetical protein
MKFTHMAKVGTCIFVVSLLVSCGSDRAAKIQNAQSNSNVTVIAEASIAGAEFGLTTDADFDSQRTVSKKLHTDYSFNSSFQILHNRKRNGLDKLTLTYRLSSDKVTVRRPFKNFGNGKYYLGAGDGRHGVGTEFTTTKIPVGTYYLYYKYDISSSDGSTRDSVTDIMKIVIKE